MSNFERHLFISKEQAKVTLNRMLEVAAMYGYVTVADFNDLVKGRSEFEESKYGLSYKDLEKAHVLAFYEDAKESPKYYINFPEAHPLYNRAKLWESNPTPNKPAEPLSITIYTEDVDDAANTIAEVFKYVYTIKDRPVHICLM